MSTENNNKVVCVTGGSGYIGSYLVSLLLSRGYTVNTTVKDLSSVFSPQLISPSLSFSYFLISLLYFILTDNDNETKHLETLEGAKTHLRLFRLDLLDYDSILAAVSGTSGVFHIASPCIVDQVHDPQVISSFSVIVHFFFINVVNPSELKIAFS